jgi:hypothetical protein
MKSERPYLTAEQLKQLAAAKYLEARRVQEADKRTELLKAAQTFTCRAKFKNWLIEEITDESADQKRKRPSPIDR